MSAQRLIAWLTKNMGWRLTSLAIAYVIWMNVATEPEMATIVSAPVQYRDAGNELEISSTLVDHVELETRGPSGLLRSLSASRPAVILDFSEVKDPGQRTFTITRASTNFPQGVDLLRATPAQIRLTFEHRARKFVPVHVRFLNSLPGGAQLKGFTVIPPSVEIFGPASQVNRVAAVETDSIDLNAISPNQTSVQTAIFVPEPKVRFSTPPEVTVKVTFP